MPTNSEKQINDIIQSDIYGISSDYLTKYRDKIRKTHAAAGRIMRQYGHDVAKKETAPPLLSLQDSLSRAAGMQESDRDNTRDIDASGIKYISNLDLSGNSSDDIKLLDSFTGNMENAFSIMNQYRKSMKLISELKRVIKIIARDVRNPNEFNKKSLNPVFENNWNINISDDKMQNLIDNIRTKIIDKYELESKTKEWVLSSMITGAKPVAVFGYDEIISSIHRYDSTVLGGDTSTEDFISNPDDIMTAGLEMINDIDGMSGKEETSDIFTSEGSNDINIDKILTKDILQEWSTESFKEVNEFLHDPDIDGSKKESYKKLLGNATSIEDGNWDILKEKLKPLIDIANKNIKIISPEMSSIISARHTLRKKFKYKKNGDYNYDYVNSLFPKENEKNEPEPESLNLDGTSYPSLKNEAIIIEYEPEHVIPVRINSTVIGYYVIEQDPFSKEMPNNNGTFADFMESTGVNSDSFTAKNSDNIINSPFFSPNQVLNSSVFNSTGSSYNVNNKDNINKISILEKIIMKTISFRLKEPNIMDDKAFKDSIVNLIREGFILRRSINLVYIPAEKMVYYSSEIDSNGLPVSILDGTLFYIYLYLMAIMSNNMVKLMKSENKEKLLLNIGLAKRVDLSISEIERVLSSRSINVNNMFGDIGTIFKNASAFQRYTIPVFGGEQLYDVVGAESQHNIEIDDEYTPNLLNSILTTIGVSPSILNMLGEAEFSRSIVVQHIEYKNNIIDKQTSYDFCNTKLIRLLIAKTGLIKELTTSLNKNDTDKNDTDIDANKTDIDIDYINTIKSIFVRYNPPIHLNITNTNDTLSIIKEFVDNIMEILFGSDTEFTKLDREKMMIVKKELYKKYMNGINWGDMQTIVDSSKSSAILAANERKKEKTINDGIEPKEDDGY